MNTREMLTLSQVQTPSQIERARELFLEYANSLGFSLCFQNFDKELAGLPGDYAPPDGRLLVAEYDGRLAGCVALHRLDATSG
jgi:putative acetyltransferase